jgi:hypothetical protein
MRKKLLLVKVNEIAASHKIKVGRLLAKLQFQPAMTLLLVGKRNNIK